MTFLRDVKDNWICTEEASGKGLVFFSFYIGFHLKNLICSCPSLKPFFLILEIPRLRCSPVSLLRHVPVLSRNGGSKQGRPAPPGSNLGSPQTSREEAHRLSLFQSTHGLMIINQPNVSQEDSALPVGADNFS